MSKLHKIVKKSKLRRRLLTSSGSDYGSSEGLDSGDSKDPSDAIVSLRFQEMSLRHSDVRLLQGPHELNKRLLTFYYTYLQTRRYRMQTDMFFLTPAMAFQMRELELRDRRRLAKDLQLANKQFIFAPILYDEHWSLVLVSRPDRKFYYFDSEDSHHVMIARLLYERLQGPLDAEDYEFTMGRCLQQAADQGTESGVHLMCMTDTLADYVSRCGYATSSLLVAIQEVRGMREAQLQLIRTLGGNLPKV